MKLSWVDVTFCWLSICLRFADCALTSEVHSFIDAHFRKQSCGINMYFCTHEDAIENMVAGMFNSRISKRVRVLTTTSEDDWFIDVWSFSSRASVFVDSSCSKGLQLLKKNTLNMNSWFRWLIYVDNIPNVLNVLNTSRLEFDSDVTLLRRKDDNSLEFLRLSRMYFTTPLLLSANYSLQELTQNEKLGQAIAWRGEEINFMNQSFDAVVILILTKHKQLQQWHLLFNNTLEPGVEEVRRYYLILAFNLMQMYNFTVNLIIADDWGTYLPNGSFSGALGIVSRGEAEFGFVALRQDTLRGKQMDFSFATWKSEFYFILIQPKTFGTPAALVVPFTMSTWVAFLILILGLIVAMRITVLTDKDQLHNDSWGGSALLVVAGVSQNGIPDNASVLSSRMTYLVVVISLFFMFLYYNVAILNGLILPSPDAIQNFDQLIESNTAMGATDVKYIHYELRKNDTNTKLVKQKFIPEPYLSLEKGIERVRKGRFALYVLDITYLIAVESKLTEAERCLITEIRMIRPFPVSFFWRKRSPFAETLNRGLITMRERGVYDRVGQDWLGKKPKCDTSLDFAPIKFDGMAVAYTVFTIGVILSFNIIVFELIVAHRLKKKQRNLIFLN